MAQPVNSKSLLSFVFGQMEKLEKNEIDVETAKAQAKLCKQANNLLNYEINRTNALMKLRQHNFEYKDNLELREIESKNFNHE
jgi:hypothetical protein